MSDLSILLMVVVYAMHNMHNMHGFTSYINLLAFIATKKLKWKPFQTFICDIWSENDILPPCDVGLATHTSWCRLIDSESLGMDEHCGALTPSWDRLLTEGELEDGLYFPSLTACASAQPGLVATWYCTYFILLSFAGLRDVLSEGLTNSLSSFSEAQNTCRESNVPRPARKTNRLFTFSSGSAAKTSPVIRLGICQKIYTTQFSGERILHTENALIETIFASNKQQKCIIISNLALFWLKLNKMCKFFNSYEESLH